MLACSPHLLLLRINICIQSLVRAMEDIILQYTYPRIDAEVTKHRNHLLKAPFCVHPATGRVCVPVDPARVKEFDPEKVPTVGQLLRELNTVTADVSMSDPDKMSQDAHHSGAFSFLWITVPVGRTNLICPRRLGEDVLKALRGDVRRPRTAPNG